MARQRENRLGIAGADRGRRARPNERAPGVAAPAVNALSIARPASARASRDRGGEPLLEEGAEIAEAFPGERHARRHRMAAALDQHARLDAGAHDAAEIDAGDRTAGAGRLPRRSSARAKAGRSKRSFSRAATMPTTPGRQPSPATTTQAPRSSSPSASQSLGLGRLQHRDLDLLARAVEPVEFGGDRRAPRDRRASSGV